VSNVLLFSSGWIANILGFILILLVFRLSSLSVIRFFRDLGAFWFLIAFSLFSGIIGAVLQQSPIRLLIGAQSAVGLLTSIALAHLFMSILPIQAIRDSLLWFIYPISPRGANHTSLAIAVMLSAIPGLLDALGTSRQAIRVRGLSPTRNPLAFSSAMTRQALVQVHLFVIHTEMAVRARGFLAEDTSHIEGYRFNPTKTKKTAALDFVIFTGWILILAAFRFFL
jgi:energy-coupling factor transporter transmembrane protein EcfT